ncbi:hypothetical protein PV04_07790 [Phialophora macrospora]|uniref:F-box domain-containing protein n=1 Tax=Phialophora macrospora TaxID=1851006 RepID=A0A0D2CJX7_9EURO|nr:hypothetical protein PV04_07790 [Phialophora macrospora]
MVLDHDPRGAPHEIDMRRKRPKLSGSIGVVKSSVESKDVSVRSLLTLADLPPEILQHVFTFADPITLGRLICVNRTFRSLLDPACRLPPNSASSMIKHLPIRKQDFIWTISRRTFLQGFPKPMDAMTELEMWRLVRGHSCQFCGKKVTQLLSYSTSDPWNAGPGLDNVRPIWPFRVRSCGRCLQPRLVKDTELVFSSSSALRSGLPFAILTPEMNYIPSSVLLHRAPPPHIELIKYYFRPQVEELERRFHSVEALGTATLGEWKKGLETSGQERNADATRFEQWELHNGFTRISVPQGQSSIAMPANFGDYANQEYPMPKIDRMQQIGLRSAAGTPSSGYAALESSIADSTSGESHYTAGKLSTKALPGPSATTGPFPRQDPLGQSTLQPPRQRTERSQKEAKEARIERRKEIERRCLALSPPIMPSTLTYMDAFQAAILISLPLDDKGWDVLKPRLLAQRADAEQREIRAALSDPSVQQAKRQQVEEEQRVAQENTTHMWHGLKISSREKIRKFADEFIHLTWSDGRAVTKATASKFAAEVLCHIRQHFDEAIAQEDHMLSRKGIAFPQDPESLACRKLKLHDMKWAFTEFVQPHTQRFGKELFLCHVCDTNQKLFAFEAIIQHFASKHTNALSHGNSIVSWDADWPIEPPFDPHPNLLWALGTTSSAPKGQSLQQSHSHLSRGMPISAQKEPRSLNAIAQNGPPYTVSNRYETPSGYNPGNMNSHYPTGFGSAAGAGTFTRSSIARSEASRITMEDEHDPQHPSARAPHTGVRYHRDSFTGGRLGQRTVPHHLPIDLHVSRDWEPWREEQPLSHSSMVYSYEDGSSRFSYGGSLARVHGVRSETGRESRATSHISVHKEKDSEPGASLSQPQTSKLGIDQTLNESAVQGFLESFDPMVGGNSSSNAKTGVGTVHPHEHQLPVSMPLSQRVGGSPLLHQNWDTFSSVSSSHLPPFPPPAQEASLPIRELEQHTEPLDNAATQQHYSISPASTRRYEVSRGSASGGRYVEQSPELPHRLRYGSESEDPRDVASANAEPLYQHRYVYDRDGRKYEEIREMPVERYPIQHDRFSNGFREPYTQAGRHYVDDRGYFVHGAVGREDLGRPMPRTYQANNIDHLPQQTTRPSFDDRYRGEEQLVPELQTRTLIFDDRDVIYQPIEPPMRATARSLGRSRPDD